MFYGKLGPDQAVSLQYQISPNSLQVWSCHESCSENCPCHKEYVRSQLGPGRLIGRWSVSPDQQKSLAMTALRCSSSMMPLVQNCWLLLVQSLQPCERVCAQKPVPFFPLVMSDFGCISPTHLCFCVLHVWNYVDICGVSYSDFTCPHWFVRTNPPLHALASRCFHS